MIIKGLKFFARDAKDDEKTRVTFASILHDTLSLCQEKFKVHGCRIELNNIPSDTHLLCQTVSISQAILNLLNNAFDVIKTLEEKWVKIECEIHGEKLFIKVTDSGKGIPGELRAKIMQPFFSTKPIGKGTGLGLSILKGIIGQHEGQFYLDEKSENTCFVIELPIAA